MQKFETALSHCSYYKAESLLYLKLKTEPDPTLELIKLNFEQIHQVLGTTPVKAILDMREVDFMDIPKDVMEYMGNNPYNDYQLSNAILIQNLAHKILTNFYLKVVKPKIPTKTFNNASLAMEWLNIKNSNNCREILMHIN